MLSGINPFQAEFVADLIEKIKKCEYTFPDEQFSLISENAKDLIRNLL